MTNDLWAPESMVTFGGQLHKRLWYRERIRAACGGLLGERCSCFTGPEWRQWEEVRFIVRESFGEGGRILLFSESRRKAERIGMDKINAQLERTMKTHLGCLNI